jgi:hypothetical protein
MSCSLGQQLPPEAISIINTHLASIPAAERAANARHVQHAMEAHTAAEAAGQPVPLLGLLMPNLHAVLVVVTGSHSEWQRHCMLGFPRHDLACSESHLSHLQPCFSLATSFAHFLFKDLVG